jgi:hypothetical protein
MEIKFELDTKKATRAAVAIAAAYALCRVSKHSNSPCSAPHSSKVRCCDY